MVCRTHEAILGMVSDRVPSLGGWRLFSCGRLDRNVFKVIPLRQWPKTKYIAGWWFGCHEFYFPINIGFLIIPIDELIFFRGVAPTTNQICVEAKIGYGQEINVQSCSII